VNRLRDAIERNLLRERPEAPDFAHCFMCGRTFTEEKGHGLNGRFCSTLCLDGYDAGLMPPQPPRCSLPMRGDGFVITCKGCKCEFVSRGLRCCSAECDRQHRERQDIEATIAGMAMESTGYVKRKCQHCGGDIPRYQGIGKKRRETRKDARFCSPRCQQRAKASSGSTTPVSTAIEAQKPAWNGHSGRPPQ
jgi:hypothetical protein